MTVATITSSVTYLGNGVTTAWTFSFIGVAAADLEVIVVNSAGTSTTLSPTLYSVTVNAIPVGGIWGIGGTVTYPLSGSPLATGNSITINRVVPYTQSVSINNQGAFYPQAVEQGLDILELQVQQINTEMTNTLRFPVTDISADGELPTATLRANKYLGFDSSGNPSLVVATPPTASSQVSSFTGTLTLAKALYGSTVTLVNGAVIVVGGKTVINDGYGGNFIYKSSDTTTTFTSDILGFVDNQNRRWFRQFSGDLNAKWSGATGDGTTNDTTALQAAMDVAFANLLNCYIPAGKYLVTGLTIPGSGSTQNQGFRLYGQGAGIVFSRTLTGQTTLYSVTDAPVLVYTQALPNQGTPNYEIDNIRFEGNSTTPVVKFDSFYNQSHFHHCGIFQTGIGNGFQSALSNTVNIHDNYALNRDWNTTVLGLSRVGIGFYLYQTISTGLTTLNKNTSRGFKTAYKLGDNSGSRLYKASITNCECSVTYNGIWLTPDVQMAYVNGNYFEGGDQGIGILDQGDYNVCSNNVIFAGYVTGIDSQLDTYGNVYTGNVLSAASVAGTTLIILKSNAANGGPGKVATGNTLTFSGSGGSIANVIGIDIIGIDPRLDLSGNIFNPRGPWVGGSGTAKIVNQSTSGDTTTGTGVYGLDISTSILGNIEAPHLARGSINIAVDPTTVGLSYLATGVLTIGQLSCFTLTFASPTNITSIIADNLPDKHFMIYATGVNTVFKQGTLLKLAGSVDFTPGANGALLTFQVFPGGVVREVARTAY